MESAFTIPKTYLPFVIVDLSDNVCEINTRLTLNSLEDTDTDLSVSLSAFEQRSAISDKVNCRSFLHKLLISL
jgi:hypothetical protein